MNIRSLEFRPYNLKLKHPFKNSSFTITERNGFTLTIVDENSYAGLGDVSPLPGFSTETHENCEVALNKLHYSVIGKSAKGEEFNLIDELQSISNLPSLRFGVEQAFISLLIQRGELTSLLNKNKTINVNGVVSVASHEKVFREIDNLLANDFTTIKVKVGSGNFKNELGLINSITDRIDNSIKIRLDVNGNWNYEQAEVAVNSLNKDKIELIEQPVSDINELIMLSDFSPIHIAVDEIIKNSADAKSIIELSNITTIVLKPSLLGGIIETIGLIKSAEKFNKKVIISSAFESVVGRSALFLLASLVEGNHAHGLNTATFLEADLANDEYKIESGKVFFNHTNYPPKFSGLDA